MASLQTLSAISVANTRQFLKSTLFAKSTIPYTDVRNELSRKMDRLAIDLSYQLEAKSVSSIFMQVFFCGAEEGITKWN
jgi:hypothetical protein